jgi:hypothetical protein
MTTVPTPSEIASLDNERIEQLALSSGAQALRGDEGAFGNCARVRSRAAKATA